MTEPFRPDMSLLVVGNRVRVTIMYRDTPIEGTVDGVRPYSDTVPTPMLVLRNCPGWWRGNLAFLTSARRIAGIS